jgi:hypothetical protein
MPLAVIKGVSHKGSLDLVPLIRDKILELKEMTFGTGDPPVLAGTGLATTFLCGRVMSA